MRSDRLYMKSVIDDQQYATATVNTSNVTAELLDTDAPTIQSVTAQAGTYASGQHVPITVTFSEFVELSNARVTINNKEYSAAELSMNNYGVTAMLWYPVQDTDATTVIVNDMTGVEDVFGNALDTSHYPSNSIADVALKSVLMRNAPTALTADYANGKASFTMQANMERAYKNVYNNYHTPAGTEQKEAPFRLELRYDSAVEPTHRQVLVPSAGGRRGLPLSVPAGGVIIAVCRSREPAPCWPCMRERCLAVVVVGGQCGGSVTHQDALQRNVGNRVAWIE